ncbi:hypothetical protein Poli38472_006055 [Pythium oligandrum]|uniref:Mitochondrial Rho GTPase n=1 Tax=Pythium oligandrum TaxID=41045 RepID=A0A8K1CRN7_PYTOL|nr:hypothetical protein Poli38472_006055 [Pythium oligandrum]|eukprot:TMW68587.1 hypothetical protein Poli38472_006055 [Pythium oligandrum]
MVEGSLGKGGGTSDRSSVHERDAVDAGLSVTTNASASLGVASAREKAPLKPQVVRIEVLGDEKVGKTSLICSLVSRHFSERVPAVLLNAQIPAEENNENVIISITDTSSRVSDIVRVANATKRSDAILLVYDLTRPETIQRLRRWLDLIARHKEVPVVLIGNKDDIKTVVAASTMDGLHSNQIRQLTNTYQFAVDGGDCSARNFAQVARAFYYAQKAVLYPVEPLYNGRKRQLEPKCVKVIKRAFRLYDRDRDGILSREELNDYQHDCFGMRLLTGEMDTMMEFLQSTIPEGVKEDGSGLRFDGFVYLWQLFIDRKRPESCWQILRTLGYNNELHLEIPPERISLPPYEEDQSAQLTPQAVEFLDALLRQFDGDKDGNLTDEEINEIFSICEDTEAPWKNCSAISSPVLYQPTLLTDKVVTSRASWLALWSFVAQENPDKLLETFFYLGFNDKLYQALEFTKSRSATRQASRIDRNVVTCYMFAASRSLKTEFAHALVNRKSVAVPGSTDADDDVLRAINALQHKDNTLYLLLTEEIMEGDVDKYADVLCLLFNPLDAESCKYVEDLDKLLPNAIPRVLVGLKPDDVIAATPEWEIARQSRAPNVLFVEDTKTMTDAFERLVRTATRPPNARARGSALSVSKTVAVSVGIGVTGLVGYMAMKNADKIEQVKSLKEFIGRYTSS